jgi:transglutaminase-like putative cysteine protease
VLLAAAVLAASAPAARQGPAVLPDSIYRLAVDSARYPAEAYVYLLDDGVLRYEPDGRGTRTYRQVIQVLKESAVGRWAEFSFSYEPRHEKLTVNWVRVVKPGGEMISDRPGIAQDADVPAAMGDPSYVERKVRRLSMPNVRPGTLVDYSYTVEELAPYRRGDFFAPWTVNPGILVRRSRLVLDTPAGFSPNVSARNLTFAPVSVVQGGRRITTWATRDVPKVEPEPFAADSNDLIMTINVGSPSAWGDVGAWYAGLAKDRYAVTPDVEARLGTVVAGARTLDDSVRAVHRYVAHDVRYVAISLGMGGYQPRAAAQTVATGYGDCKDKATLFIALMGRLGFRAYPVLLSAGGNVQRELPTIFQFNHAIAAVERPEGRLFVDLTAGDVPYGSLPQADQGQFVLVVHPDGRTEETTTPEDAGAGTRERVTITGVLDTAGVATTRAEMVVGSLMAGSLREILATRPDSATTARFLRQLASGVYPESEGDSLTFHDDLERGGDFRVDFVTRKGRAAQLAGPVAVLSLPMLRGPGDLTPLINELRSRRPRRFPIDLAAVSGGDAGARGVSLRLEVPAGWHAQLPKNVSLSSAFGDQQISYSQEGRILTVTQWRRGRKGILPPSRVDDLIAWLTQVEAATRETSAIVLTRGS